MCLIADEPRLKRAARVPAVGGRLRELAQHGPGIMILGPSPASAISSELIRTRLAEILRRIRPLGEVRLSSPRHLHECPRPRSRSRHRPPRSARGLRSLDRGKRQSYPQPGSDQRTGDHRRPRRHLYGPGASLGRRAAAAAPLHTAAFEERSGARARLLSARRRVARLARTIIERKLCTGRERTGVADA